MKRLKASFYRLLRPALQDSEGGANPADIGQSNQVLGLAKQRLGSHQQEPAGLGCILP